MKDNSVLAIGVIVFLAALAIIPSVPRAQASCVGCPGGGNDYVGGYFTNSQASATKAYFSTDFTGTVVSNFPSCGSKPCWIGSEISIDGESTSGSCPCLYQTGYILWKNGTVDYVPQVWGLNQQGGFIEGGEIHVGGVSSIMLSALIEYDSSSGSTVWKAFVYQTESQVLKNNPNVYNILSYKADSSYYYGTTTVSGYLVKEFQFGVEDTPAVGNFTSNKIYISQGQIEYYSSSWGYQAAKSIEGDHSYWVVAGSNPIPIGGYELKGVDLNKTQSTADNPSWWYNGTTIGDGTTLWTGTGGGTPFPCQVSGRC